MKNINVYSITKMTVRDGMISYDDNICLPYYQEVTQRSSCETTHKQSWLYKIELLIQVLKEKYILVKFENEK